MKTLFHSNINEASWEVLEVFFSKYRIPFLFHTDLIKLLRLQALKPEIMTFTCRTNLPSFDFWSKTSFIFLFKTGTGPEPCLANYNWPFRITLLTFSVLCGILTLALAVYMFQHRKVKVFKVASPIFLTITLLGCAIMYLEMAAIFPILDAYSCIGKKFQKTLIV